MRRDRRVDQPTRSTRSATTSTHSATVPIVVYCEVGQRGHTATALMHELGIKARNLDGGYQTWSASMRAQAKNAAAPIS